MARFVLNVIPDEMLSPTDRILGDPADPPDQPPLQLGTGDDVHADDEYACGWCDTVLTIGDDPHRHDAGIAIRCPACGKYNATGEAGITRTPANADALDRELF